MPASCISFTVNQKKLPEFFCPVSATLEVDRTSFAVSGENISEGEKFRSSARWATGEGSCFLPRPLTDGG